MSHLEKLKETIAALRAPEGCPWDRKQTHESLRRFLIEECSEFLETIDAKDFPHMQEELGDVLLQVYLHAQIASEAGHFTLEDVAQTINEKMIRRHPHVFGDTSKASSSEEVESIWEKIKSEEKQNKTKSIRDELPPSIPALLYGFKVSKKLNDTQLAEGITEEEAGKYLWEYTQKCTASKIDPESALRKYINTHVLPKLETKEVST